jgi:hypothetical protein
MSAEGKNVSYKRNDNKNWRQAVNRSTPLVGSLVGVIIILATVINVAESVNTVIAVAVGILLLEVSIWYAANPIFTNGRQYLELRDELDRFIDFVRQLNRVATGPHTEEELKRINADMHGSVDAMVRLAGNTAPQASGAEEQEPEQQAATQG